MADRGGPAYHFCVTERWFDLVMSSRHRYGIVRGGSSARSSYFEV
jgi:hypothetical protein